MAILDTIHLDIQIIDTKDPKRLIVLDTSTWGFIEDKIAIIEVITPGRNTPKTYTLVKGQANIFNSSNLYLSPVGVFNDLPDGIYTITIKGSPDSYCKTRAVLKTDKTRLKLAEMYLRLGFEEDSSSKAIKRKIQDNELLIRQAEHSVSLGEISKGSNYLSRVLDYIEDFNSCETCN